MASEASTSLLPRSLAVDSFSLHSLLAESTELLVYLIKLPSSMDEAFKISSGGPVLHRYRHFEHTLLLPERADGHGYFHSEAVGKGPYKL